MFIITHSFEFHASCYLRHRVPVYKMKENIFATISCTQKSSQNFHTDMVTNVDSPHSQLFLRTHTITTMPV